MDAERAHVVHHRSEGAAFSIVVAKTGSDEAAGHRNYSLFLVPTETPGWRIVRHPEWMGSHSPGSHPEVALEDVRVPAANLLGREGEGFVIAQKRLAGGRLAHAMRWIGAAQRALDLSAKRLLERKAFGKELARHQGLQFMMADSAMDLYAKDLLGSWCCTPPGRSSAACPIARRSR
jgi:alkylation response protein AidB-like acyl-CoA dehydrogenase